MHYRARLRNQLEENAALKPGAPSDTEMPKPATVPADTESLCLEHPRRWHLHTETK